MHTPKGTTCTRSTVTPGKHPAPYSNYICLRVQQTIVFFGRSKFARNRGEYTIFCCQPSGDVVAEEYSYTQAELCARVSRNVMNELRNRERSVSGAATGRANGGKSRRRAAGSGALGDDDDDDDGESVVVYTKQAGARESSEGGSCVSGTNDPVLNEALRSLVTPDDCNTHAWLGVLALGAGVGVFHTGKQPLECTLQKGRKRRLPTNPPCLHSKQKTPSTRSACANTANGPAT